MEAFNFNLTAVLSAIISVMTVCQDHMYKLGHVLHVKDKKDVLPAASLLCLTFITHKR